MISTGVVPVYRVLTFVGDVLVAGVPSEATYCVVTDTTLFDNVELIYTVR